MVDETSPRYEGWRVALASGVGVFVSFASLLVYTFGLFLKPLAEEFGWSREAVSAAFGVAAMTVAVCSPALGYLLDRVHPRRVIVPCLIVFGCAFASLSLLTPHLWHLYAVFVVLGAVGNGTAQMAYSRAVTSWFARRRGTALALVMSGGAVGAMVLPPVAAALIRVVGWRNAYMTLGAMVLAVGVPTVARFIRERPAAAPGHDDRLAGCSVREAIASRIFWIVVTVLFCSSIAQNGAIAHISALLTDRGVSAGGGALALSAMGGASLVGRLLTDGCSIAFSPPVCRWILLTAAALGTFLLSGAHTVAMGVVAAALIGLGMGGEADVTPYLLSRYFGLRSFSVLYGLTWTFYAVAGAVGPVLMGKVFDATGSYETLLVRLAIGTLAISSLMLLLPRYDARLRTVAAAAPVPANVSADVSPDAGTPRPEGGHL